MNFKLVVTKTKPNRCKKCRNRSEWPVLVKNQMGTVGTIKICMECDEISANGHKTVKSSMELHKQARSMLEMA